MKLKLLSLDLVVFFKVVFFSLFSSNDERSLIKRIYCIVYVYVIIH